MPTGVGVWAPTIRYRDGVFYVIVTIPFSPQGLRRLHRHRPGRAVGRRHDDRRRQRHRPRPRLGRRRHRLRHLLRASCCPAPTSASTSASSRCGSTSTAGKALEEPRSLWSGTGLKFPEAPHIYQRGDYWYLLIAEGGTERGHGVSVARGPSPEGPFEGHPANPVLSARSTSRPIQNTGHGDLVETPDGGTALVHARRAAARRRRSLLPAGPRDVHHRRAWVDGWPQPEPVELRPARGRRGARSSTSATRRARRPRLARRPHPCRPRSPPCRDGRLTITGRRQHPRRPAPALGRPAAAAPHRHRVAPASTPSAGVGGLAARYDEKHRFALEARGRRRDHGHGAGAPSPGSGRTGRSSLPSRRGRAPRRR